MQQVYKIVFTVHKKCSEVYKNFLPLNTVSQHEQEQYSLSTTLEYSCQK